MSFFDKIRSMPPLRQFLLALGVLLILGFAIGSAYFVFLRQPDAVLFSNLRPMDAATIVAELDKRKVAYRLAEGGTTILVAEDKVDATRLGILSQDLPLKGAVGFELFNKSDIGLTEFAQKINYQRALQGELSRTIMAIDAIDTARVHLTLPEETIFRDDRKAPKASVALSLKLGRELSAGSVLGIQRLVAASVSDLSVADVVVLNGEGQVISNALPAEVSTAQSPAQHAAEIFYADKVRQALFVTYPGKDFAVRVTASPIFRAQSAAEAGSGEEAEIAAPVDPFLNWTTGQRDFQLKVNIAGAAARDAEAQHNIRVAASAAIEANPDLGDEILVSADDAGMTGEFVAGPQTQLPARNAATTAASTQTAAIAKDVPWLTFWGVVLIVAVAGLAFAVLQIVRNLVRVKRPVRSLTEEERRDFANRFQVLLEQGERNAADRF